MYYLVHAIRIHARLRTRALRAVRVRAIFVNAEESGEHIEPVLQSRKHIIHAPEIEMAERRLRVREAVVVRCDRRAVPVDRAVRLRARVAEGVKIACEEGAKGGGGKPARPGRAGPARLRPPPSQNSNQKNRPNTPPNRHI